MSPLITRFLNIPPPPPLEIPVSNAPEPTNDVALTTPETSNAFEAHVFPTATLPLFVMTIATFDPAVNVATGCGPNTPVSTWLTLNAGPVPILETLTFDDIISQAFTVSYVPNTDTFDVIKLPMIVRPPVTTPPDVGNAAVAIAFTLLNAFADAAVVDGF